MAGSTKQNPWGSVVDAKHVFGDYWFVERYAKWMWALGGVLTLTVPPVGAAILGYLFVGSLFAASDEIPATIE